MVRRMDAWKVGGTIVVVVVGIVVVVVVDVLLVVVSAEVGRGIDSGPSLGVHEVAIIKLTITTLNQRTQSIVPDETPCSTQGDRILEAFAQQIVLRATDRFGRVGPAVRCLFHRDVSGPPG